MASNLADADQAGLDALTAIEDAARPSVTAALDKASLCQTYKGIKAFLNTALMFIEKIPVYGGKIATAVRFLMGIADMACAQ
jgi:hypothetical protein